MHDTKALALLLVLGAAAGCGHPPASVAEKEVAANFRDGPGGDDEALAFVIALDEHSAQAGTAAENEEISAGVRDLARSMRTEHQRHADETRKLAAKLGLPLAETAEVTALRESGAQEMNTLGTLDGSAFETAYEDAVIQDHADALNRIDGFLTTVTLDKVKTHLRKARETFAHHLDLARNLNISAK